jgi:DHA1 family bicyclomycin/chloramphenicol resistance-like MFS transporter
MTTAASVQLTLTGMLAGLALGQLFVGPVADAVGRRAPLLAGIALHIVASVLCVVAPNIAVLRRAARAAGPGLRRGDGRRHGDRA